MAGGRDRRDTQARAKERFLEAFKDWGTVTRAAQAAGVSRQTVYRWRQEDESFALAWADIDEVNVEELEAEARRRAVEGVDKPIYFKGELVDTVREYSNDLLMFLLKARRPEVYRDRATIRHEGKVDVAAVTPEQLRQLSDEELAELEAQLAEDAKDA